MKNIKNYKIFESANFNSMSDEELKEKLHWLRIEHKEISEEISKVVGIINDRKEAQEDKLTSGWDKSIFNLNSDQISWVLEHGHHTTSKHYKISHTYLNQLDGVLDSGFSPDTNQYSFYICTSGWKNDRETEYQPNESAIKSVQFLINNLKRVSIDGDDVIKFQILFSGDGDKSITSLLYYNDTKIIISIGRWTRTEFNSLEEAIKYVVESDIEEY